MPDQIEEYIARDTFLDPYEYDDGGNPAVGYDNYNVDEYIEDYSTESLEDLEDAGYTPIAVYESGAYQQVNWADVTDPRPVDEAEEVAAAFDQHFWSDTNGAHVTDCEQEDWETAVDDNFSDYDPDTKPYHNALWNSLGMLFRSALNNLVSITRSAIAFYDGNGNDSANIVAQFGAGGATIGKPDSTRFAITSNRLVGINNDSVSLFDVDYSGTASRTFKAQGDTIAQPFNDTNLYQFGYTQTVDVSSADTGETISIDTLSSYGAYMRLRSPTTGEHIEFGINSVSKYACDVAVTQVSDYNELRMLATATRTFTVGTSTQTTIAANNIYCYLYAADGTSAGLATMSLRCTITYDADAGTVNFVWGIITDSETAHCLLAIPQHRATWQTTTTAPAYTLGTRSGTSGGFSVAAGLGAIASQDYQTALGSYNVDDTAGDYLLIVGNGTADNARSNAMMVDSNGDIYPQATKMADFVVEQGTSGIWTYRKWNSGIAECWGRYSGSIAVNVAAAAYGGYRSNQITVPLPSGLFTAAPRVVGTFTSAQGIWLNNMAGTTASNVLFYLSSGTSYTAATRYVDIHAFGNWQ